MCLLDGIHYRIEGNLFKPAYRPEPMFFQGHVVAGDTCCFEGTMFDEHGPSTIRGALRAGTSHEHLEFKKEYEVRHRLSRGGSPYTTEFSLNSTKSGGYAGFWRIPATKNTVWGYVTLAIVRWEEAFPVMPQLHECFEEMKAATKK